MISLCVPALLPLILSVLLCFWPAVRDYAHPFLPFAPWLVLICGQLLAWRFNRGRLAYSLGLLAVAELVLQFSQSSALEVVFFNWTALLLPLCLTILVLLPEKGFFTITGLSRPAGIVLLIMTAFLLSWQLPEQTTALFTLNFIPNIAGILQPSSDLHLTVWLLLLLLTGGWVWKNPTPIEMGLLTALLLSYPALQCPTPLTRETWLTLAGLAPTLAIIEMSHLMAFRDELTGLPGRRALNEAMQRLGARYTIAMLDIDHFKKFNDRHGHDVGDQVLRMVATRLARVSGGGKAFRYGGEEFTILFPGQSLQEAIPFLEEVRKAVECAEFTTRRRWLRPKKRPSTPKPSNRTNQSLKVTISIGVTERIKPMTSDQAIKAADKALYKAKKSGRNRVCN
jgi:diguanylate cyclase (GGDEF)-like protein